MPEHWVVIYDIRDDKRLRNVAKTLQQYGVRVQYSGFELLVERPKLRELRGQLQRIIAEEDYVVYVRLCERDWQRREKYGRGPYAEMSTEPYEIL